jgi:hypothetical protein
MKLLRKKSNVSVFCISRKLKILSSELTKYLMLTPELQKFSQRQL